MIKNCVVAAAIAVTIAAPWHLNAQTVVEAQRVDSAASVLPANTMVVVTPAEEITSIKMKEGTQRTFLVVEDVVYNGAIVIPRGSPVQSTVTYRTGKGIVGKSAKFELSFDAVRIGNQTFRLRGQHRQEGRGNTAGALLGSAVITGKSAVMIPGQTVNVFTAEPIPFR
jgi:hypothetical protein